MMFVLTADVVRVSLVHYCYWVLLSSTKLVRLYFQVTKYLSIICGQGRAFFFWNLIWVCHVCQSWHWSRVVNETYDAETETRPRHWSDGIETRPRRQCHQSETIPRRDVQNNVSRHLVETFKPW